MPALHIRILGDFHIAHDDAPVTGVNTPRLQSLLAYLLLHSEAPQLRQQAAFLLWPDSTEAQARTNLRRELHHLRRALPGAGRFLQADAKSLQWLPDAPFTLDVADFEAAVAQAHQAEEAGHQTAVQTALAEAVELYRGDLLLSCYDDWILPERERLSHMFIQAMERLIQLLESRREYATAIRYARRLLRYDPLHEATYRRLMRLHALNGDRARALRVYHTCVTVLQRELAVEPSPATHEAYQRLLDMDTSPASPATPVVKSVAEWRLVGRQPEWEQLLT
ncbi:MAG: 6-hydroxy-D-nicotine oxidase, partial [Chloroflexi bacterium]